MEGTTTGCFDSLFAAFGKRNNSSAESSRIPPAYTPPTEEKLPAYEDCVSKAMSQLDVKHDAELERIVSDAIQAVSGDLRQISLDLHENMETGMKEYHAHQILTDYLEKKGFKVTRHAYGMETAFTAEFTRGQGRRIGFCSEYDGLPGLGQGCGHNCIAIAGVAAAIGVKAALESGKASGKVMLFGTPAEELSIGKIVMVQKRAFQDNVDACLMLHPAAYDSERAALIAIHDVRVEFFGKASHASAAPWEGVNALDAMVQLWNNISMMRQQLMPTDRVHGIVTDGGKAPNVIPDHTSAFFFVRTTKYNQIVRLMEKMENCFRAAAMATGCEVKWTWREIGVTKDVVQNGPMADVYKDYMERTAGTSFPSIAEQEKKGGGSTDMGNVSYEVPTLHPMRAIGTTAANHTIEFTKAAATKQAHEATLQGSEGLAVTALKVLNNDSFFEAVKKDFESTVRS
ncbi:hypothetical protein LRAMOSA08807 [Lichtheimia ramosa]|uniref:Peptidase M20 domain-containing protein 2 n=1 Tax=Lichtheimia ramosa TaxID=688394 RepID=A0A077WGF9_9FUNG|nr:hypothetical protein LRAMOSA08807 [Lichtheimia ramosa]